MKTTKVKLAGKSVNISYCYATEIAFHGYTKKTIPEFINETHVAIQEGKTPNPSDAFYFVLAAMLSYYEGKGEEAPIKDSDLLYHASPDELNKATAALITLFSEWYAIPADEPKPKATTKKPKNG